MPWGSAGTEIQVTRQPDGGRMKPAPDRRVLKALEAYANGGIGRDEAIRRVGVRDYADLLVVLGDAGLTPPWPPEHRIEREADAFVRVWEST